MVKIIADTTSGITLQQAKELDIPIIPQIIIFGEKSYRDDTELDTTTFLKLLKGSSKLPKTAAPPPALYHPHYEEAFNNGDSVIVICPSQKLSGTYRSASVAAQEFPNADIRIMDTKTIGGGLASTVLAAAKWANEGLTADQIEANVAAMRSREKNYFVVNTLEYLHKGGRIGGAQALFGSVLQVKPILKIENGQAEPVESQRTQKRALARLQELILADCPTSEDAHLSLMHGDTPEKTKTIAEALSKKLGITNIPIYELPPAFLVHAGPGTIGASFFVK